jgi:hypothetical protein
MTALLQKASYHQADAYHNVTSNLAEHVLLIGDLSPGMADNLEHPNTRQQSTSCTLWQDLLMDLFHHLLSVTAQGVEQQP